MSDISQDKHLKMLAERNRNERRKLLADLFGTAAYHYLSYAKDDDKKDASLMHSKKRFGTLPAPLRKVRPMHHVQKVGQHA